MLKFFHLTVAISAVFTVLPGIALGRPLSVSLPYPVVPNSDAESMVCYIKTEDGITINLESLCKKTPTASDSNSNSGSGKCYFIDSAGRPCKIETSDTKSGSYTSQNPSGNG